jgi:hypothetical protein
VYLCGERDRGQSDGVEGNPALVLEGAAVTRLACGESHYVVATQDGKAYVMLPSSRSFKPPIMYCRFQFRSRPTIVHGTTAFHFLLRFAWGSDDFGQAGSTDPTSTVLYNISGRVLPSQRVRNIVFPDAVAGAGYRVTHVAAGFLHSYAVTCATASESQST